MKPLESQVEFRCHQALLGRVKELLNREGLLPAHAGRDDVKAALLAWFDLVEGGSRANGRSKGANCEDVDTPWH